MSTQYHQQAQAHTRPPTRRQPLGPGDARANMHPPQSRPGPGKSAGARVTPSPQRQSHHAAYEQSSARRPHGSPVADPRASKRVSDMRSQAHDTKRDSEISNASSTGSASGRKRTIGQWQLGRTIGKGGCSTVRLVRHVVTGQQGAVKIISRKMAEQVRAQSLANLAASQEASMADLLAAGKIQPPPAGLMREIAIMKLLDHDNIIRLFDVWENHNELYLVMEYVPGGELFHYVEENRGLSEQESVYIFRQIIAALLYCHRLHIHHRDLKPENILLDREKAQVKLVDFGMAALQPEGKQLTTACGSPHYAAPEVIRSRPYDGAKADVWSCGVILYVMLTGSTPFNYDHPRNLAAMYAKIQAADYVMPDYLSFHAKDLLRRIFVTRPEKRISMDEIWDHPLLHLYDREFGYEGAAGKKERWVGPAATLDEWTVNREEDIDKEILRNMRTLWHSVPQPILVKKLLSSGPNQEKFFYAALAKHKEEHLENYTGGDVTCATSDYQHARNASTQVQQKSQSTYSIMNNEHLRSSSIAADRLPVDPAADTTNSVRAASIRSAPQIPRGAGHKRGNSQNAKGSAQLRVEMLKKANQQARQARAASAQKESPAPSIRSRSASRASISKLSHQSPSSSNWPSSPPVTIHVSKPSATHKRNVSFQHIRKASTASAVAGASNLDSVRQAPTPDIEEEEEIVEEEHIEDQVVEDRTVPQMPIRMDEDDDASTTNSSPTRRAASVRKARVPVAATPRSRARKPVTPGAIIRTEVRKVSTELEKACEEAFFRSSYASTEQTVSSTTERQDSYDTPPSSVSNGYHPSTLLYSPSGRPLPAVPTDTPNTFIARTLEETRNKLVAQAADGSNSAKINEVLASLDRIMPADVDTERRSTSAPEPKPAVDNGFLPIITEEPLPDTLRVGGASTGRPQSAGLRSFTAPGPVPRITQSGASDSIRVVDRSPGNAPASTIDGSKRASASTEEASARPKTSEGPDVAAKHLRVPGPREQLGRKKSYDSAIGIKTTLDEIQPTMPDQAKKESFWFRRWKKSAPAPAPTTVISPTVDVHPGNLVHIEEDDKKQRSSLLKRDKQPPQPLDLSRPAPTQPLGSADSEFPMRRVSESEAKGFSKWLNKLGRKEGIQAIEIKDPQPSPGINTPSSIEPSPRQASPTAVNAQSWFSRFFRMQPASHVTAFCVPRTKARTEIYRLLRSFQAHGISDLCYYPQESAIMARVEKNNALGIKPVQFRVELYVVLQNKKKSGLSLARWTQVRGAASGFEEVVRSVERILGGRGLMVQDEGQRREMVAILG